MILKDDETKILFTHDFLRINEKRQKTYITNQNTAQATVARKRIQRKVE